MATRGEAKLRAAELDGEPSDSSQCECAMCLSQSAELTQSVGTEGTDSSSDSSLRRFIASDDEEYKPDSSTAGGSGVTQWLDIIDDVVFALDGLRSQIEQASKECRCGQNVLRPYPVKQVEECSLKGRSNAPSPDSAKSQADLDLKGESDSDAPFLRSRFKKLGL